MLALLLEDTKNRPDIRYNAILSLITGIALITITTLTLGCGALLHLILFYWAYQAMMGQEIRVPFQSDSIKKGGWV